MRLVVLTLLIGAAGALDGERLSRAPVTLTWAVYSSTPQTIDVSPTATTRIDAVWIGLQDARVRTIAACKGADAKAVVAGAFTVELVKHYAATAEARLEVARYCTFDVRLRRTKGRAPGAPSELKGASIVVEGRRSDGVPFRIRSRLDTRLTLRAADLEAFAISEDGARWIVGVDIARWLADVDLMEAPDDGPRGRIVVIDEKASPELLARFNANVEHGVALFEDRDGDKNVDADERARPIAVRR